MNILCIDSREQKSITVSLKKDEKLFTQTKPNTRGSQSIITLIEEILKESELTLEDITALEVNAGPGSFTGLRVGVAVANALSFSLNIPVNKKKNGEFVYPTYE